LVPRNLDCFVEAGLRFYRLVLHLEKLPLQAKKLRLVIPIPVLLRQARPFSTVLDGFQSLLGAAMRLHPRSLGCRYSGYVAARLVECSRLLD
jgi:hypothetical protein